MDILLYKNKNYYYSDSQPVNTEYMICFIENFDKNMNYIKEKLFQKNKFYNYFETLLISPEKLFDQYSYLQDWSGSPAIKFSYLDNFQNCIVFNKLVMEFVCDSDLGIGVDQVVISDQDTTIKFTFSSERSFDKFVGKCLKISKENTFEIIDNLCFDNCGFKII